MSQATKGYIIAIIGVAIWSTTGILIDYLFTNYGMSPLLLTLWRSFLVCVALAPALLVVRRSLLVSSREQIQFYVPYGALLAVFGSVWAFSVKTNGAAVATVLGYSSAGFTAILSWWFFKEQLWLPKIVATILSMVGCVLVSNAHDPQMWHLNPVGVVTGLLSGVLFAGYNMLGKVAAHRQYNVWTSLLYMFVFATLSTLVINRLPFLPGAATSLSWLMPVLPVNGWLVLIILSFIPTILGFGLYNTSMLYLPASTSSLIATSEPAMTAVQAYLFLNERLSMVQLVGSLIILSAVIIVRFEKPQAVEALASA